MTTTIIKFCVEILQCKLKHKPHMLKKVPWRWPTIKAETCKSINKYKSIVQKAGVEFMYEQISIKFGIDSLHK